MVVLGGLAPSEAEVRSWSIGAGSTEGWQQRCKRGTGSRCEGTRAVDMSGQSLSMLSTDPTDNIVGRLTWLKRLDRDLEFVEEQPGGRVWDNVLTPGQDHLLLNMVDGLETTSSEGRYKGFGQGQAGRQLTFDLGTRFPVDRIVFYPRQSGFDQDGRPLSDDYMRGYDLYVNDGTLFGSDEKPSFPPPPLRRVELTGTSVAEQRFPLQFVRYIYLWVTQDNPFEIAEFEVYGSGFPPTSTYLSEIIEVEEPGPVNFTRLTWSAELLRRVEKELTVVDEAAAAVSIRMRTGADATPITYYRIVNLFTGDREEVDESTYAGLDDDRRGGAVEDQDNWSLWSAPFDSSGSAVALPGPRKYFQFEIRMTSDAILDGVRLNSLAAEYTYPPLAQGLVGEVSIDGDPRPEGGKPTAPAGRTVTFVLDIDADVEAANNGFDSVEISTPGRAGFRQLWIGPDFDNLERVDPEVVGGDSRPRGLFLSFPDSRVESRRVLRVVFDTRVFQQATTFSARVSDSANQDEPPQEVQPGNANPAVSTLPAQALRVLTSREFARRQLVDFRVEPRVITPNRDGANDEGSISYTLVELERAVPVDVEVFDLSGRRVLTLLSADQAAGAPAPLLWDGSGGGSGLVPPGVYVVRIAVHTDRETITRARTVAVAY